VFVGRDESEMKVAVEPNMPPHQDESVNGFAGRDAAPVSCLRIL
jgi:hypothetical protein